MQTEVSVAPWARAAPPPTGTVGGSGPQAQHDAHGATSPEPGARPSHGTPPRLLCALCERAGFKAKCVLTSSPGRL